MWALQSLQCSWFAIFKQLHQHHSGTPGSKWRSYEEEARHPRRPDSSGAATDDVTTYLLESLTGCIVIHDDTFPHQACFQKKKKKSKFTPFCVRNKYTTPIETARSQITQKKFSFYHIFLDPRGGSRSLTHVVVLHLLLVDFFVSQPTVFIETSWNLAYICKTTLRRQ